MLAELMQARSCDECGRALYYNGLRFKLVFLGVAMHVYPSTASDLDGALAVYERLAYTCCDSRK